MYPTTTATTDEARPSTTTTKATAMPTPPTTAMPPADTTATTPPDRPKSKQPPYHAPKTARTALRLIVKRLEYIHPVTGHPLSCTDIAALVSGGYGTRRRGVRRSGGSREDQDVQAHMRWWGNEAGEAMCYRAVAASLRTHYPEVAALIHDHHNTVERERERERQRSCRQRKADEAQKMKRREASRERRKREKAEKVARIPELEARAFQIRQEQRNRERAARESVHAAASTPSTTPTTITDEAPAPPPRD